MSRPTRSADDLERTTERWLIRRGLPHFIDGYSAREDIFTRALPFLTVVFLIELLNGTREDVEWWINVLAIIAAVAIGVAALASVNRFRGRRPLQRPDRVGIIELAAFVLVAPFIALVVAHSPVKALDVLVGNLVILAVVYVVTSYGLLPMTRWAIVQTMRQLANVTNVFARSLPLLLLFTMFMFFNAELWKIADDLPDLFFWSAIALLVAVGSLFIALRLPRELTEISHFDSWAEVGDTARDTPVAEVDLSGLPDPPNIPKLRRRARANVGLVLFFSQAVQIVLVTVTIGAFYVAFGSLTVVDSTIAQWTGQADITTLWSFHLGSNTVVVSLELVRTSVFVAAVAGLQFTVAALTDSTYRVEFYTELSRQIRRSIAVRDIYAAVLGPRRLSDPRTPR